MKTPILTLLAALLAHTTALARKPKPPTSAEARIQKVLDRVMIPKLELRAVSLHEALDFLSNEIRKHDAQGRGIPFILEIDAQTSPPQQQTASGRDPNPGPETFPPPQPIPGAPPVAAPATGAGSAVNPDEVRISVSLANITITDALRFCLSEANLGSQIRSDGVHISASAEPGPAHTRTFHLSPSLLALTRQPDPPPSPFPQKQFEKILRIRNVLDRLIIPKLELHRASLREALAVLGHEIRKCGADARGIQIVTNIEAWPPPSTAQIPGLEPPVPLVSVPVAAAMMNPDDARITVALTHISLREALRYIGNLTNVLMRVEPDGIYVFNNPPGISIDAFLAPMPMDMEPTRVHTFHLTSRFWRNWNKRSRIPRAKNAAVNEEDFRLFLVGGGTKLFSDSSLSFNRSATLLTVRDSEDQFAFIQAILDETERGGAVPGPEAPKAIPQMKFIDPATLDKKLQSITLPKVVLKNVTTEEAAATLGKLSARYDSRSPREDRGVNILAVREPATAGAEEAPLISYSATNVPLKAAIEEVARLAHRQVSVKASCVIIANRPPKDPTFTRMYLLPPTMMAGIAREVARPHPQGPIPAPYSSWFVSGGVQTEPEPGSILVPGSPRMMTLDTAAGQKTVQDKIEASWRNYYAAKKAKKRTRP